MRSLTRAAFAILLIATLFIVVGWVIPFWFSRGTDTDTGIYWNIFYVVECVMGTCADEGQIIKESLVFLQGETGVQLEAIAVLATVALAFCLLSVLLAFVFQFAMCGDRTSYFYLILGAFVSMCTSVVTNLVSVILAAIAVADFFDLVDIQNAFEFPWSVLLFGLGALFLAVSAILYAVILNSWKLYRHIYSRERYYFESPEEPVYTIDKADYDRKEYFRRGSLRRSYSPTRDYSRDDVKRIEYYEDYRRDYRDDYRNSYRKSRRPDDRYDRKYPREYRKSANYYDRYRDTWRYEPYHYGGNKYDRQWQAKFDEALAEANWIRMTSGNRLRDRDRYYY